MGPAKSRYVIPKRILWIIVRHRDTVRQRATA